MTYKKEDIINLLEKFKNEIHLLYKQDFINYRGKTSDTGIYYTEIICEWLLENKPLLSKIPTITREESYKTKNHNGIMLCNGHAYHDNKLGSKNTNFALLVSLEFDQPFKDGNQYAYDVSKLANQLSGGGVIVQRYGDIKKGRRSTEKRILEGYVKPTLKEAVPGDLGLILPYNVMKSLIEMTEALDSITPGIANDHTLFYGVEAKFYSDRPEVNDKFETKIKNLYVGGDGAGITRGLAQAGASGVWVARDIICKEENK